MIHIIIDPIIPQPATKNTYYSRRRRRSYSYRKDVQAYNQREGIDVRQYVLIFSYMNYTSKTEYRHHLPTG